MKRPLRILVFYHYHILGLRVHNIINTFLELGYEVTLAYWQREKGDFNFALNSELLKNRNNFKTLAVYVPGYQLPFVDLFVVPLLCLRFFVIALRLKFDILHFTHLMFLPLVFLVRIIKRVKIVYDAHEFYILEFEHKLPISLRWVAYLLGRTELFLIRFADAVFTIDSKDGFYAAAYRKNNSNTFVLYNVPRIGIFNDGVEFDFIKRDKNIVYVGAIEDVRGKQVALESFLRVKKEVPDSRIFFIGPIQEEAKNGFHDFVRDNNLEDSVFYVGWSNYEDMSSYLNKAYVGIALYQKFWQHYLTSCGNGRKIFTYMERGLPVIGPDFGDSARIVKEEQCGILIDTSDPAKVSEALIYLFKHPQEAFEMSCRARKAVEYKYNWGIESRKVIDFYKSLDEKITHGR